MNQLVKKFNETKKMVKRMMPAMETLQGGRGKKGKKGQEAPRHAGTARGHEHVGPEEHREHARPVGSATACTTGKRRARRLRTLVETAHQSPREIVGIEIPQVVQLLAHADLEHGKAELVADRKGDAAFRGAVELRDDERVKV